MSNLLTKTKYVSLVIRKVEYPNEFDSIVSNYINSNCTTYAYICHSADINGFGELEHKHYHFVLEYKVPKRLSTFLNEIVDTFGFHNANGIEIDRTASRVASIQYLIHKNNPEKTQHALSEIISSIPKEELESIMESEQDDVISFQLLYKYVQENPSRMYLMQRIGLNNYIHYRNAIVDMIQEYQARIRHEV